MDWHTDGVGERQTIHPAVDHEEVGNDKELHPQREKVIQVSQVRELIEVKEVITSYGRSGS